MIPLIVDYPSDRYTACYDAGYEDAWTGELDEWLVDEPGYVEGWADAGEAIRDYQLRRQWGEL